jgi:starch synthase
MRVLFATSESYPLAKTGGLGDVCGALPTALMALGVDVRIILPAYPQAIAAAADKSLVAEFESEDGSGPWRVIAARMPDSGVPVYLVDCPGFNDRAGTVYRDEHGRDWPDNAQRFARFCHAAARLARGELDRDWQADVVHSNDWPTGLLPTLLALTGPAQPATVFTIHNLAYQGVFPSTVMPSLGVPDDLFTPDGIEFYGQVSFLKAGIRFADAVTTVSPSYAREILTPDYGCGLDGLLRHRGDDLTGILNGVDYDIWDPAQDPHLTAQFNPDDMAGKRICKSALQAELGLEANPSVPLLVWLSRITDQKMADVVCHALHLILNRDVQLAFLGEGDPGLEAKFRDAGQHYPGRLAVRIGYEEPLAHRLHAGADLLLHPSRFEPCGLTPLYAMRYGTLPVVRHVGGLTDTVMDASEWAVRAGSATGFAFRDPSASAMLDCLDRALAFYAHQPRWRKLQQRAMSREFGWDASARRYLALYRKLAPTAAPQKHDLEIVRIAPSHVEGVDPPARANTHKTTGVSGVAKRAKRANALNA